MAKYYVESGTLKLVIQADDPLQASLWAVSRALHQVILTPQQDSAQSPYGPRKKPPDTEFLVLGRDFRVNEFGFGNDRCTTIETADLVTQWGQLMATLNRIEKKCPA
ncbi:MAG: hypothetical protein VX346_10965 [Planctomycetota bacterium]|nr:hypothetical protein [Planctomycetota bacterium]